ncbi:hypothetical protein TRFO_21776 [Tritrichomonas foetus]|uniref:USP domain-containing protein n=1 Tax=Tritrichomonas foetus TaxID=1144522 RepID=A0A1J4KHK4_9EUKA|nr:hypothetical protein TRFO_21776 [Tritrichomonas foetus]|eukprot:OHT09308.1 hypothetical protein TRFO_21776 [Tritrichomonas foetus]
MFLDYIVQFSESISKQANAEEFFNTFLSTCVHNKLLNNILLHDYQTTVVYTFTCTNCQNESVKEESHLIIYLNLNSLNEIDMNQLILLNKKGNVKKICENCKKNTKHEAEIIHLYSKYILYVIKRYDMLGNKIEVPLNIQNDIEVNNEIYTIIGIIEHYGSSILNGHYVSYIHKNEWFFCNDHSISQCSFPAVSSDCYILLYKQAL